MDSAAAHSYTYDLFLNHGIYEAWPTLSEECPSCYEPFGAGPRSYGRVHKDAERPVTPKACPGYHIFHLKCLTDWLSFGNQTCPCCRHPLLGPASLDVEDVCWECEYQLPPAFGGHKLKQDDYDRILADDEISEEDKKEMMEWDRIWTARPAASLLQDAALPCAPTPYDDWNDDIRDHLWAEFLALPSPQPREGNRAERSPTPYGPSSAGSECAVPATEDPMEAEWLPVAAPVVERIDPGAEIEALACNVPWGDTGLMSISGDLFCVSVGMVGDRLGDMPDIDAETYADVYPPANEYLFNEWMLGLRSYEGGSMGLQWGC